MCRYVRDMDKQAKNLGWAFAGLTGGGHRKYVHPHVQQPVFVGSTPSDQRAIKNNVAQMRRLIRQGK